MSTNTDMINGQEIHGGMENGLEKKNMVRLLKKIWCDDTRMLAKMLTIKKCEECLSYRHLFYIFP